MSDTTVHVFAGRFADRREATAYTEEQRRPGSDGSASDPRKEGCRHWELRDDLQLAVLNPDYVETVDGPDRWSYLDGLLPDEDAVDRIRAMAGPRSNTVVLIYEAALGGTTDRLWSTPALTYCGAWPALL